MRRTLVAALGLAALAAVLWLALTSFAPPSAIATWAPCPRNWAWAPAWRPRASPLAATRFELAPGVHGKLCYGRPALGFRRMLGSDRVPFGRLWRTGANEPTTLHVDGPVRVGGLDLPAGSYAIYTVPDPASWQVIVNRATRQWGLESEYTDAVRAREVGRFRARAEVLDTPVETLTFRPVRAAEGAVDLLLEWQTTRVRIPVESALAGAD
jgi:hypothetical protein